MSEAPERIWTCSHLGEYGRYYPEAVEAEGEHGGMAVEYIRADHVDALLKAEREKALREALTACDKALSDMQAANPNRHDALPYIEDGCEACKDAIEALISEDKTDG